MLATPERRTSQNVAFLYSASTHFAKSVHFIPRSDPRQNVFFVAGPPLRPATPRGVASGQGVSKCFKICSKIHFLRPSRCVAGPRFVSKLVQIDTASLVGPPLAASNTSKVASGKGVAKRLKICSKIHFLRQSRCVAGPAFWSKLIQIEASSLVGPPFRPEIRRRCQN